MNLLGRYEIQRSHDYILTQDLQVGGAIQLEFTKNKHVLQLDNGLVLQNKGLKEAITTSAKTVGDDVLHHS